AGLKRAEEELAAIIRDQRRLEDSRAEAEKASQEKEKREAEAKLALIAAERQAAVEQLENARAEERKAQEESLKPGATPTLVSLATVTRVEGEAFLTVAGSRTPARAGQGILPGQGLETVGTAVVVYADGTRLNVGPQTLIDGFTDNAGKRIALGAGRISAEVAKQPVGRPLVFVTPHGEAKVLGTSLFLRVNPASTELEVKNGSVRLIRAKEGMGVEVASGNVAEIVPGADFSARAVRVFEFQDGGSLTSRFAAT